MSCRSRSLRSAAPAKTSRSWWAHFLDYYNELNDRYVVHIQREAMEALRDYHWPGNVRELQNYVERAVVMADSDELTLDLLPPTVIGREPPRKPERGTDIESLTV